MADAPAPRVAVTVRLRPNTYILPEVCDLRETDERDRGLMVMTPRLDGRTLIIFGNHGTAGAWIMAHRLNAAMDGTARGGASFWLGPGSNPQFASEVMWQAWHETGQLSLQG